ncbi:MAG: hypothetical protein A4E32_00512 [Methanomassiliicoccales archaeon PtaU1.Bin124]|nr:MAG: hypothetical protein A4E32_00512 [Methanomassiliicoccales archaeon PtaU1.Bin124]
MSRDFAEGEGSETTSSRSIVRKIAIPIRIGIDPMVRLMVADFKDDPEFTGLEPQLFDDQVNGKGIRLLRYRKDGMVDVYWQPGVMVERSTISIGAGIADFMETAMEPARFVTTDRGIDVDIVFKDAQGRTNQIKIKEDSEGIRPFPFLAPVGLNVERPLRLFMVEMLEFDFVRRKNTLVKVMIGDRPLKPAYFPIPRSLHRVFLMRYGSSLAISTFNPPMDRAVMFDAATPGSVMSEGMTMKVDDQGRTVKIQVIDGNVEVVFDFEPGFPNLTELDDGTTKSGNWTYIICGHEVASGKYSLSRKEKKIQVEFDVTGGWKPTGLPFIFKFFTTFATFFKKWPTTYRWRGVVDLNNDLKMSGTWERKKSK